MSDFEGRVREALGTGAEHAPHPVGLADGARRRLRRRRVVTATVLATAAVLTAVPVGIALLGDDGSRSGGREDNVVATELPEIPDGWKWVAWHDAQVAVPGAWDGGAISQWCVSGDQDGGVVDNGEGVSTMVACSPAIGYGVRFVAGVAREPLVDHRGVAERLALGGNTVDVVAPDQETLDAIVASAHEFEGSDSRGCTATFDAAGVMGGGGYEPLPDGGVVSVCSYTGTVADDGTTYDLSGSGTLSEAESARLLQGIADAPAGGSASCSSGPNGEEPIPYAMAVEVRTAAGRVAAATIESCGGSRLRTADGEFDGADLWLSVGWSEASGGGPAEAETGSG